MFFIPLVISSGILLLVERFARVKADVIKAVVAGFIFNFLMGVFIVIIFAEELNNSEVNFVNLVSGGLLCNIFPFLALIHSTKEGFLRDVWVDNPRARIIDISIRDIDEL